jgi:hypothetical protein
LPKYKYYKIKHYITKSDGIEELLYLLRNIEFAQSSGCLNGQANDADIMERFEVVRDQAIS